jgi:hypothetical protein
MNLACYKYCCENIENIENFNEMINDATCAKWDCHHKLEIDKHLSAKQLKEMNLYYLRPANELIFLRPSDHHRLHALKNT